MLYYIHQRKGMEDRKMSNYYYMNKEHGYLVRREELFTDAMENEYDDILDPCSVEYGNYSIHYSLTNHLVV
jgi:hypothetical protein